MTKYATMNYAVINHEIAAIHKTNQISITILHQT
jgi:hypothetical protein